MRFAKASQIGGARTVLVAAVVLAGARLAMPQAIAARAGGSQRAHHAAAVGRNTVRYEAEDAWLSSGLTAVTASAGVSGRGYAGGTARSGARAIFTVGAPADGTYAVTLRYANGGPSVQTLAVNTNGIKQTTVSLSPTTGRQPWAVVTEHVALRTGLNTVAYVHERGAPTNLRLDYIDIADSSKLDVVGATVPYDEYEAEDAHTNGAVIGPDRLFGDLAAEATGRKAVTLRKLGQFVEFTLRQPANGMVMRYSLP